MSITQLDEAFTKFVQEQGLISELWRGPDKGGGVEYDDFDTAKRYLVEDMRRIWARA